MSGAKKFNLMFLTSKAIPIKEVIQKYSSRINPICNFNIVQTEEEYQNLNQKY
jgi:ketopantoate reductase